VNEREASQLGVVIVDDEPLARDLLRALKGRASTRRRW
jgi:hypothetical protein